MTPQKQVYLHDPDNGRWGDCWRTAWAMILDQPVLQVPHFCEGGRKDYLQVRDEWLRQYDLCAISIPFSGNFDDVVGMIGRLNSQPFLVTGRSPRGTNHVVVCQGGGSDLVHDPHPDGGGLVGPCPEDGLYWVEFCGKLLT